MDHRHLASYAGREQAAVKHFLVDSYLERLIMITAQAKYHRIAYVDGFAGPWKSAREDLGDTSFGRAVEVMKRCRVELARRFKRSVTFRALFVERDPETYARVRQFAEQKSIPTISLTALNEDFASSARSVADGIQGDEMAFVLIDPTGWKDVIAAKTLASLLQQPNVEMLINVMWNFIKLASGHASQQQNLREVFGQDSQALLVTSEPSEAMRAYLAQLKEAAGDSGMPSRLRTAWFPVEFPSRERIFYYLTYATHHVKGIIVFLEESERAFGFQREVKLSVQQQQRADESGITDMFGDALGSPVRPSMTVDVNPRAAWLTRLPTAGSALAVGEAEIADMAEQCGCFISQLQMALRELIEEGVVQNKTASRPRTKNVVNYHDREVICRLK